MEVDTDGDEEGKTEEENENPLNQKDTFSNIDLKQVAINNNGNCSEVSSKDSFFSCTGELSGSSQMLIENEANNSFSYEVEQVTIDRFENDEISFHIQSAFSEFSKEKPFDHSDGKELMLLDLPDSVLLKIFSNLSHPELCRIALVCKHWLWIVYDSELWKYVDFSQCNNITEQHILSLIRNRLSPLLRMVDLSNCPVTPMLFHELTEKSQNLETLVLQNSSFHSLKTAEEGGGSCSHDVEADSVDNIDALEEIKKGSEGDNNKQLVSVPDNLIRLDIRNFKAGFQFVHLILEVQGTSNLECFGFGNDAFCPTFKDFQNLIGKMSALRVLECVDCENVTDAQVGVIADRLKMLESLVLKKCKNFTGSTLPRLIISAEHLKSLNLSGTDLNGFAITETPWEISILEELDLSFCDQLTAISLTDSLWKIKTLQHLALNNTGRGKAVTAEIFSKVYTHETWKDLLNISLHFSNKLQPEALYSLRQCSLLKRLSVRTCHKINFNDVANCIKYFPNLISLEVGSLFPLDRNSVDWIDLINNLSVHCTKLRFLTILKCAVPLSKVSHYRKIISMFFNKCTKLVAVSMLYSEEAIGRMFQECSEATNRYPGVTVSTSKNCTSMPPFQHSLDSEINKQKFQKFFGY